MDASTQEQGDSFVSSTLNEEHIESEKDFVLFVDKEGKYSGNYEPEPESTTSTTSTQPQGAINEETGEINWDCPCLQSALAPPCGDYFRAAFSCFVASKNEPKGSECLDQFAAMQDCFRSHPEIYLKGANLEEEEGEGGSDEIEETVLDTGNVSPMNDDGESGSRSQHADDIKHAEDLIIETPN